MCVCRCVTDPLVSAGLTGEYRIFNRWVKALCSIGNVCTQWSSAAAISLQTCWKKENFVHSDTPVCIRGWGIFWIECRMTSHGDITKHSQSGEEKKKRGWRMSKNGNTESVFSAASVLNSLAYLWFCSKTVTQCREWRLDLVIGFNRKCGVTSERGRDGGIVGWRGKEEMEGWRNSGMEG